MSCLAITGSLALTLPGEGWPPGFKSTGKSSLPVVEARPFSRILSIKWFLNFEQGTILRFHFHSSWTQGGTLYFHSPLCSGAFPCPPREVCCRLFPCLTAERVRGVAKVTITVFIRVRILYSSGAVQRSQHLSCRKPSAAVTKRCRRPLAGLVSDQPGAPRGWVTKPERLSFSTLRKRSQIQDQPCIRNHREQV